MITVPENMQLKEVEVCDHDWLVNLHNDPEVLRNLTNSKPITMREHRNWWEKIKDSKSEKRLIFTINNINIGFTKFYSIDYSNSNCILGADIEKTFRGCGYAKFMWTLMLQECFDKLGLHRVALNTASFNEKAIHIYKKLGFKEEGKLVDYLWRDGKYHDCITMYMLNHEWKDSAPL